MTPEDKAREVCTEKLGPGHSLTAIEIFLAGHDEGEKLDTIENRWREKYYDKVEELVASEASAKAKQDEMDGMMVALMIQSDKIELRGESIQAMADKAHEIIDLEPHEFGRCGSLACEITVMAILVKPKETK